MFGGEMRKIQILAVIVLVASGTLLAQNLSPAVKDFVRADDPVIVLAHVRVIDGTGAPPVEDQTLVIEHGHIASVGSSAGVQPPAGARTFDLQGYTVIPGLVGMHDHMFYPSPRVTGRGAPPVYTELA